METYKEDLAKLVIERHKKMRSDGLLRHDEFEELARYFAPRLATIVSKKSEGDNITPEIYNDVGIEAAEDFASGCTNYIVPPGEEWARFESDAENASQSVKDYWAMATRRVLADMVASSFHLAAQEDFLLNGVFGTACLTVEEGKRNPYSFRIKYPGSYYVQEDDEDVPDIVSEEVRWTAKQCADKFGKDRLHDKMLGDFQAAGGGDTGTPMARHTIIHLVQPRESYIPGLTIATNRPYAELWIDESNNHVLAEGGFYENPNIVSRMYRNSTGFWGYSLAMRCLPKLRQLCEMEEDKMLAQELLNNPPWVSPNDGADTPSNIPGDVTYYDASLDPKHRPAQIQLKNQVVHVIEDIIRKEDQIRKTFFADMFQTFADQPKTKTATEVLAIMEQRLVLFTTFFGRYTKEKLERILERCLNIAIRNGRVPPPPLEVMQTGGGYRIIYASRVALAVKLMENRNLFQLIDIILPLAQADPSVLHVVKLRDIVRRFADNLNVDPSLLNDEETIRETLIQLQQFQQAMQGAEVAEKVSSAVGKAPDRIQSRIADRFEKEMAAA